MAKRRCVGLLLAVAFVVPAGCGDNIGMPAGPYDEVDLAHDLKVSGLSSPVHIVRDEYGVAHITADNVHDAYFAQGYVMAHDRLPQMDILRRFGTGTVAELFGLDEDALESDLEMRVHRMKPTAEAALAELRASSDPVDQQLVVAVDAFAGGVNAYVADIKGGKWSIDPAILAVFDPERFAAWEPADSLVLGRFQAFALSWTAPIEVDITDIYQESRDVFDAPDAAPKLAARKGAGADLVRIKPIDRVPTIDGFPNVDADAGTRSNDLSGASASARRPAAVADRKGAQASPAVASTRRPRVPRDLLRNARKTFRHKVLGPHAMFVPRSGSNNWAVAPAHTSGGPMLAGDPHLNLPNPSIFYPTHLTIPGQLDVQGSTFPGIPGVLHGHNGNVAWASTVVYHDVNDIYFEQIQPCAAGGDCVAYKGGEVAIETWEETVNLGSLGTIFDTRTVTYERVPHHGHIIPTIEDGAVVPRTGNSALSVRYTGHEITHEIKFLWKLNRAKDIPEAFASLTHFQYGGQNWVFIDKDGNIGWSTHVDVPKRAAGSHSWHPVDNPTGVAPFFVMPGDGSAEWEGMVDSRYIPHAYNPDKGYIVTANSDPVGATFDGDPLNGPVVSGEPLFLSSVYAPGVRTGRIDRRLQKYIDDGTAITPELMADIQTDTYSNLGHRFRDHITAAVATIDATPSADVAAWIATLDTADVQRLRDASARLAAWSFQTPPAVEGSPSADETADSVATTIFNVWGHHFLGRALADEYAAIGWSVYDANENVSIRTALALLEEPETLYSGLATETGQPILCDDMGTTEVESCTLVTLQALHGALQWLASDDGLMTADMDEWQWGRLHTLTLEPLFPNTNLNVPPPDDANPDLRKGYPRAGDNFVVNRADCTWDDTDFAQDGSGPAQRMVVHVRDGRTTARIAIPGGTIYNPSSSHFRDLMDNYYIPNKQFQLPYTVTEVVSHGEARWLMR